MECREKKNLDFCTCSYVPCPRKGRCCECIIYHRERDEIPGCFFPPELERTYDRSLKAFITAFQK
ncbi:MAG: DUF6485 family protein [Candidatus Omnitrophica bacterium]|nr:DUF6485 family protein [Candidatus Omnitrophota bacterium]MCM8798214.1 DUF6485 family protein [Candidatus Omnitrophota bacterium]